MVGSSVGESLGRYGLLSIFTALHRPNTETEDPRCKAIVEQILVKCVQPHLRNPRAPFMRRYACQVVARHSAFQFSHPHMHQMSIQGVLRNLRTGGQLELPVRVEAACALQDFLDSDIAKEVVRPLLKEVLQVLFTMMDMLPIDEVVDTLQKIIDNFGPDLKSCLLYTSPSPRDRG